MKKINVLDKHTINKIAAGEVVERPASVVKELVENSIDAGAGTVNVEIKDGGIGLIRISDNGLGIERDEVKTAFMRHATSKIQDADDLLSIASFGFRGEALASIAAVSYTEIITKTKGSIIGTKFIINGGTEEAFEETGSPDGTTFIIKDLFFNVPARRKFLKAAQTEAGYISEIMERFAVSNPQVSFRLAVNGRLALSTSGNGNLKDAIYNVYGRDIALNLLEVNNSYKDISITGYIGKPVISRGNRNFENYFVNGRYIKNPIISKAIEDAYKTYNMQHKYPFTVLNISMPSEQLDVNVHPAKLEVRFADGEAVYKAVHDAVSEGLLFKNLIPEVKFDAPKSESPKIESPKIESVKRPAEMVKIDVVKVEPIKVEPVKTEPVQPFFSERTGSIAERFQNAQKVMEKPEFKATEPVKQSETTQIEFDFISKEAYKAHRIVGQVFGTYWIIEYDNQMYMIDQHAAHEKVIYERLVKSYKEKKIQSQQIMPAVIVSLSLREKAVFEKYFEYFENIGYEIEYFGGNEYRINAVPTVDFGYNGAEIFKDILDMLVEDNKGGAEEIILDKIASMSCKAAVKGNMRMSEQEARKLIEELLKLDNPFNCPHGRPVIITMTKQEIEKKFKRIV